MSEVLRPDICVIGAGPAGMTVATAAAMMGVEVVLVEKGRFGGAGLNAGSVPSSALIAAAKAAHEARRAKGFGIEAGAPLVDFSRVHDHVQDVMRRIGARGAPERLRALGIRTVEGAAKFTAPTRVEAAGQVIEARRFVVATGASPVLPPIRGLETVRAQTCETIFDLAELPGHLLVIGGSAVGIELAQAFRRLGSAVTVVEGDAPLADVDPELAEAALAALRSEGVDLREGTRISHLEPDGRGLALHLEAGETPIRASHLLLAVGRRPNVEGLGLETAGVGFDANGIAVRRDLRTRNRRVYAIGDVTGGRPFSHAAEYQARLVLRAILFRLSSGADLGRIPRVVHTDPEIAVAGLTEAEARSAGRRITILRWPFSENDRALAECEVRGHIKVICDRAGVVLGAGLVGPRASELIGVWQMAVQRRMKIGQMAELVLPYPTLGEVSTRAAGLSYGAQLRSPWLKRVLRWLRLMG